MTDKHTCWHEYRWLRGREVECKLCGKRKTIKKDSFLKNIKRRTKP